MLNKMQKEEGRILLAILAVVFDSRKYMAVLLSYLIGHYNPSNGIIIYFLTLLMLRVLQLCISGSGDDVRSFSWQFH